ncbi:MAG TPA: hypothetical protein PK777_12150, partial [Thermoguttaceae bacterium]|nr:hypothetical protein [Thermoguttaceae bacterium]
MGILVLNAGSSTVKFALFGFDTLEVLVRGLLDWAGKTGQATVRMEMPGQGPIRQDLEVPSYREAVFAALNLLQRSFGTSGVALTNRGTGAASAASEKAAEGNFGQKIRIVGHRLIHGGEEIRTPVWIDAQMKQTIARYRHLAPLHIPAG